MIVLNKAQKFLIHIPGISDDVMMSAQSQQ